MRKFPRLDANHHEIVDVFRQCGALVQSLAWAGGGVPDLLVGSGGKLALVEVKDGQRPSSERKLTPDEEDFHARWADYPVFVVKDATDALAVLNLLRGLPARGPR